MKPYEFSTTLLSGTVNLNRLHQEIADTLAGIYVLRVKIGAEITVFADADSLTDSQLTSIEAAIRDHRGDADYLPLVKTAKFAAIDAKTGELIAKGFTFRTKVHSLSENAQKNLLGMDQLRNDPAMVYPIKFNTLDDSSDTVIENADDIHAMFLTATGAIRAAWESGTALKQQVRDATTVAQVNAIKDER